MNIGTIFDSYTLQARIFPAFILLTPVTLLTLGLWPIFMEARFLIIIGAIVIVFSMLLAQYTRDAGKEFEKKLVEKWGGYPSSTELMYSRSSLPNQKLESYRERISSLFPEIILLNKEEELATPDDALRIIDDLICRLREKARDTKQFQLLFQENIHYGFRRNLVALRFWGVLSTLLCDVVALVPVLYPERVDVHYSLPTIFIVLLVSTVLLLFWLFSWNCKWVHQSANQYAIQLLNTAFAINNK